MDTVLLSFFSLLRALSVYSLYFQRQYLPHARQHSRGYLRYYFSDKETRLEPPALANLLNAAR